MHKIEMIKDIMDYFRAQGLSDQELSDKFSTLSDMGDDNPVRLKDMWYYYKAHGNTKKKG